MYTFTGYSPKSTLFLKINDKFTFMYKIATNKLVIMNKKIACINYLHLVVFFYPGHLLPRQESFTKPVK